MGPEPGFLRILWPTFSSAGYKAYSEDTDITMYRDNRGDARWIGDLGLR